MLDGSVSIKQQRRLARVLKFAMVVVAVALVAATMHELAHLTAAYILGIEVVTITWFDPVHLAPVIEISPDNDPSLLRPMWYAGGLSAGAILLLPLAVRRKWFRQSFSRWALGLSLAALGFMQLGQGILEGAFHTQYVAGAGSLSSASCLLQILCGIMGFLLYFALFPRASIQHSQSNYQ